MTTPWRWHWWIRIKWPKQRKSRQDRERTWSLGQDVQSGSGVSNNLVMKVMGGCFNCFQVQKLKYELGLGKERAWWVQVRTFLIVRTFVKRIVSDCISYSPSDIDYYCYYITGISSQTKSHLSMERERAAGVNYSLFKIIPQRIWIHLSYL